MADLMTIRINPARYARINASLGDLVLDDGERDDELICLAETPVEASQIASEGKVIKVVRRLWTEPVRGRSEVAGQLGRSRKAAARGSANAVTNGKP